MIHSVIMAGSTGEIGKRVLNNLIAHNQIKAIYSLIRTPGTPNIEKNHPLIVDFAELEALPTLDPEFDPKQSVAICTLGTTIKKAGSASEFEAVDLNYVVNFAQACRNSDITQFIVMSSVGASPSTSNHYLKTKGLMERALESLNFEGLHIVQPSLLTGDRAEFRLAEKVFGAIMPLLNPLMIGTASRYRSISMDTVAKAISQLALRPSTGNHRYQYTAICSKASEATSYQQ